MEQKNLKTLMMKYIKNTIFCQSKSTRYNTLILTYQGYNFINSLDTNINQSVSIMKKIDTYCEIPIQGLNLATFQISFFFRHLDLS